MCLANDDFQSEAGGIYGILRVSVSVSTYIADIYMHEQYWRAFLYWL